MQSFNDRKVLIFCELHRIRCYNEWSIYFTKYNTQRETVWRDIDAQSHNTILLHPLLVISARKTQYPIHWINYVGMEETRKWTRTEPKGVCGPFDSLSVSLTGYSIHASSLNLMSPVTVMPTYLVCCGLFPFQTSREARYTKKATLHTQVSVVSCVTRQITCLNDATLGSFAITIFSL